MKYMGSKRAMLRNGLGEVLSRELYGVGRFVDLFTGSASVAGHVALNYDVPVLASDLQNYSVVLANAIIARRQSLDSDRIWRAWFARANERVRGLGAVPALDGRVTRQIVERHRDWCEAAEDVPLTNAYGGHYFSARQAVWIDGLRATAPRGSARDVALASLIGAASFCAASPGHTAQPFQPTRTAKRFLAEAWSRDLVQRTRLNLDALCTLVSKQAGEAVQRDANLVAANLTEKDLAFLDPPYSGVHYSRFYHVLESVANGRAGQVSGVGRYPPERLRPRSSYSVRSESTEALKRLLRTIAGQGAKAILTFPNHACSNGLSGSLISDIASEEFRVECKVVQSRFSSLGGTSDQRGNQAGRNARVDAQELVLILKPR
ncbi:DNA adenine methylase [Bradyrhizobium sp. NBAIM16]|nr:DNA adenine methylase [Bradyrhizobium sp. NBAIM16]